MLYSNQIGILCEQIMLKGDTKLCFTISNSNTMLNHIRNLHKSGRICAYFKHEFRV